MKKILALVLALIMVLSLCACGSTSAGGSGDQPQDVPTGDSGTTEAADTTDAADVTDPTDKAESDTGYIGTWKVIAPSSDPFPPLILVINEDGTAGWGTKMENLEPRFWYDSQDPKEPEGTIEIAREDNMGYGNDAHITEDGKLYLEINMTVGDNSYDHLYFEKQ